MIRLDLTKEELQMFIDGLWCLSEYQSGKMDKIIMPIIKQLEERLENEH